MGLPVEKSNSTTSFVLKAVEGRPQRGARIRKTSGSFSRSRIHPESATFRYFRLPLIFGFSVFVFAMTFVGLVLLLANSQRTEANSPGNDRIVIVEKEAKFEMAPVIVPIRDIKKGEKLDPNLFQVATRPKLSTPLTAINSSDFVRGGYAKSLLIKNQPVTQEMVEGARALNPVIASIQPGYRAVTISVNATTSVEGWATAGAFVDVHWISTENGEPYATLLVDNAKILSAERAVENQKSGGQPVPTTVTLLVSERQAKKVSLASTKGALIMHLRGTEDINKPALTTTLTLKDLIISEKMGASDGPTAIARYRDSGGVSRHITLEGKKLIDQSAG